MNFQKSLLDYHTNNFTNNISCQRMYENTNTFEDLTKFVTCVQNIFGAKSKICENKIKIIRKGTWGWVRDGWLTNTEFSDNDFMFHGWKKNKIYKNWIWPFITRKFDLKQCSFGNYFDNFIYKTKLKTTNENISKQLIDWKNKVEKELKNE